MTFEQTSHCLIKLFSPRKHHWWKKCHIYPKRRQFTTVYKYLTKTVGISKNVQLQNHSSWQQKVKLSHTSFTQLVHCLTKCYLQNFLCSISFWRLVLYSYCFSLSSVLFQMFIFKPFVSQYFIFTKVILLLFALCYFCVVPLFTLYVGSWFKQSGVIRNRGMYSTNLTKQAIMLSVN